MSIEQIVQAWKNDEENMNINANLPANPVGEELSDKELQEITGGMNCPIDSCDTDSTGGIK